MGANQPPSIIEVLQNVTVEQQQNDNSNNEREKKWPTVNSFVRWTSLQDFDLTINLVAMSVGGGQLVSRHATSLDFLLDMRVCNNRQWYWRKKSWPALGSVCTLKKKKKVPIHVNENCLILIDFFLFFRRDRSCAVGCARREHFNLRIRGWIWLSRRRQVAEMTLVIPRSRKRLKSAEFAATSLAVIISAACAAQAAKPSSAGLSSTTVTNRYIAHHISNIYAHLPIHQVLYKAQLVAAKRHSSFIHFGRFQYRCVYGGSCRIDIISRKHCSHCRLKQCLTIGMDKKWWDFDFILQSKI